MMNQSVEPRSQVRPIALPSGGLMASASAAAFAGLYFLSTSPMAQGLALWALVAVGSVWVLADAWREQGRRAKKSA